MREIKFDLIYKHENNETSHYVQALEQLMADNSEWGAYFQGKRKGKFETKLIAKRQYTGLKDINKVEIYDGDILKSDINEVLGVVCFEDGKFVVNWENISEDLFEWTGEFIIGNIYENPELLKDIK